MPMQPTQPGPAAEPAKIRSIRKPALRYFGDYVLLGEIAGGGMGIVYRALQTSLDREVAIKMIHAGALASVDAVRRFHTEAEAMAKLDHPNIVSIHEIGEYEGHHYFAMKLVDGPNLAEHVGGQPLESRVAVELLIKVARAVHYAHEHGVLHRDLKPGNILLDERGQPHVTDFGIAKLVQREAGFTGSLSTLGTPEYMAPEQAVGKMSEVGTAADIYSLGAVLYHLLTGRHPFSGETPFEIMERVIKEPPVDPVHLNPQVSPVLNEICLKALAKKPDQRHGSAELLARELEEWLNGSPGHSLSTHPGRAAMPMLVTAGALLVVLVGVILGLLNRSRHASGTTQPADMTSSGPGGAPLVVPTVATTSAPMVVTTTNTAYVIRSPSGVIRAYRDKTTNGERIRTFSPTGRLQKEELERTDGSVRTTEYDLGDRERKTLVVRADKKVETTDIYYDPSGRERLRETILSQERGALISKTIIVNPSLTNSASPSAPRPYAPGPWGFVYRPVSLPDSAFMVWHDPYWRGPVARPFTNGWEWRDEPWFRLHAGYWKPDPISDTPSDWLADWLMAGYLADRYAAMTTSEMIQTEIQLASQEAEKARRVSIQTTDASERAEAKAEQSRMETRVARAEARLAKARLTEKRHLEAEAGSHPRLAPVTNAVKDQLKKQIEQVIAGKELAERPEGYGPSDILRVLHETNHIHPVSRTLSVTRATDSAPAGVLTPGDLLRVAPGQENALKTANANTTVNMHVITSKGEDDSVAAGTVVAIPLKELQEFRNEFWAKVDLGLMEVDRNKERFKKLAVTE
jgi:serine/threonine protein kinase